MYGSDILCGISKVPFEIPHKISYPYIERWVVCWEVNIWELLDLQAYKRDNSQQIVSNEYMRSKAFIKQFTAKTAVYG